MNLSINIEQLISKNITHRSESLLANDLRNNDSVLRKEIEGRKVLVIGGAGTIGSSYIRAISKFEPAKIVVIDINENGLTELVRDCRSRNDINLPSDFKTYPINFGDNVFYKIFKSEGPFDIIANFAAHKHVRSEKDIYSIEAMLENNVLKAKELLDFILQNPPKHFFCVSTDKAANPVNIMGASKKLMEEVILGYCDKFKITTARFANVAFSNGSLPFGFIERVLKHQPLSCPSDVKRFFVSPLEAGEICLCACILGESGDIFFPKLPDTSMVNFADIAADFLNEIGFKVYKCDTEQQAKDSMHLIDKGEYPVYFFKSNTSGEKLYEEFYTDTETTDLIKFNKLGIVKDAVRREFVELEPIISKLRFLFMRDDINKEDIVEVLTSMMPNFKHIETGLSLDGKM